MRVSIVIRTLNESRYLPEVLQAIAAQTVDAAERETILVDSGSTDGTLEIAAMAGCRIVHIAKEDFSFGRSLNVGCRVARSPVLVFVSGHCVPKDAFWLERLIQPIENGTAGMTYGRQVGGDVTKFSEHHVFAKYFPDHDAFSEIPFFCNNANAAVATTLWKDHLFSEDLTGLEDMEFAKRACLGRGGRLQYVPGAVVCHYHGETWRQVKRRYEREAVALQHIMPELHFTAVDALRCFVAGVAFDYQRLGISDARLSIVKQIAAFRFFQFYGTWCGHRNHRNVSKKRKQKYFYPN